MRFSRALVGVALITLAFAAQAPAQTSNSGRSVPGEILVRFKPGTTAATKADAHRLARGARRAEIARTGVQLVAVAASDQSAAIARYRRNPNVLYAEPNFIRTLPEPTTHAPGTEVLPADFYFHEQWALHNTGQEFLCIATVIGDLCFYVGTPDADIDAPEAWAISTGSPTIAVAVIDTGIDYTHPDLQANYAGGDDFLTPDGDPMDDQGHGTHVAGTIAAALNNPTGDPAKEEGVVGVAPHARLLAYKVCAADGTCSDFAIEQAIARAVADGAKVINMSFGSPDYSRSMDDAVQAAWNAGLVIVAAAGNDGTTTQFYPAALDNVISVGAFDEDDNRATFSNYGSWVDISAPGNVIMSSYPMASCAGVATAGDTGCYTWLSGTSMASPHVAGAAALVWSRSDVSSNRQVVDILLGSANPVGVASARLDSWTVHGGLNIHDALSYASTNLPPVADAGIDQSVDDTDGDNVALVTVDGSHSSDADGTITSYVWREGSTVVGSGSTLAVWLSVGSHLLTLEVTDDDGAMATDDVIVAVNHVNQPPVSGNYSASTVVGMPVTVTLTATDLETCELAFSVVQGPAGGTLGAIQDQPCAAGTPNSDAAQIVYTPGGAGIFSFTYQANDGSADSGPATVTVSVNARPVAAGVSTSTVVGTPVTVTLTATDLETCDLAFSIVQGPTSGALGAVQDRPCAAGTPNIDTAQIVYTPGAAGIFSFMYQANDGSADGSPATVTISVNARPVAADVSASAVLGTPVTVTLTGTDLETCELSFSIVQGPASGTLGAMQDQPCAAGSPHNDTARVVYTPAATGTYSFAYRTNDGSSDSNTATVTITVASPPTVEITVTGISPNVVSQNARRVTFAITGTGFANGAAVTFVNGTAGSTPRVLAVRRISSTQLAVDAEIRSGGPKRNRLWDVRVTNVDGTTAVGSRLLTITP